MLASEESSKAEDPGIILGSLVSFVAPDSGPPSERYVVRRELIGDPWRGEVPCNLPEIWQVVRADTVKDDPDISGIAGWHGYSGSPWLLSKHEVEATADRALKARGRPTICAYSRSPVTERTETARESGLTIFGYGNYVKTVVIPQLRKRIPVRCVHEIDPWQIGRNRNKLWSWDTSPEVGPDEHPDIVVIASFHHTHASIAVEAIERGARAVIIEKPIVTTSADLERLCVAVENTGLPSSRRSRGTIVGLTIHSRQLAHTARGPVSCFSIAYEVPLPPQHWYRWPNSGTTIISNGCHWIDHFLSLIISRTRQVAAVPMEKASIFIRISLENGVILSLFLTRVHRALGCASIANFVLTVSPRPSRTQRIHMSESAAG